MLALSKILPLAERLPEPFGRIQPLSRLADRRRHVFAPYSWLPRGPASGERQARAWPAITPTAG